MNVRFVSTLRLISESSLYNNSMKLQIISDIHLNFHKDFGKSLLAELREGSEDVDLLLIAGDLVPAINLESYRHFFEELCELYPMTFAVLGNHDFYHGLLKEGLDSFNEFFKPFENFKVLHRSIEEYKGVKVAGATLWFPKDGQAEAYKHLWNDFHYISKLEDAVYVEAEADRKFLSDVEVDVCMTHHLPANGSVSEQYKYSSLNRFVVHPILDDSSVHWQTKCNLWVHGHTHTACDYWHNRGRVVCNPFGYPHESSYKGNLYIDL